MKINGLSRNITLLSSMNNVNQPKLTDKPSFKEILKNKLPDTVKSAFKEIQRNERIINRAIVQAMRGKDFTPQELLALQATVYRYNQQVELVSKLVDKATNGVRQIINSGR